MFPYFLSPWTSSCNLSTVSCMWSCAFVTIGLFCPACVLLFIVPVRSSNTDARCQWFNGQVSPKLAMALAKLKKNLLEKTGCTLQKRMAMWEKERTARVFRRKFLVNCRTSWKIHMISLGKMQPFLSQSPSIQNDILAKQDFWEHDILAKCYFGKTIFWENSWK